MRIPGRTRYYLIGVVSVSTIFCIAHIVYQTALLSLHSYEGTPPKDCEWRSPTLSAMDVIGRGFMIEERSGNTQLRSSNPRGCPSSVLEPSYRSTQTVCRAYPLDLWGLAFYHEDRIILISNGRLLSICNPFLAPRLVHYAEVLGLFSERSSLLGGGGTASGGNPGFCPALVMEAFVSLHGIRPHT